MWQYSMIIGKKEEMEKNWIENPKNLKLGRWWTMLTAQFSHIDLGHLTANMGTLVTIGPDVINRIGNNGFYKLMLISSLSSHLFNLIGRKFRLVLCSSKVRAAEKSRSGLGFSGILYGVLVAYTSCSPDKSHFGARELDSHLILKGMLQTELVCLALQSTIVPMPFDHAAHIGGALGGLLYAKFLWPKNGKGDVKRLFETLGISAVEKFFDRTVVSPAQNKFKRSKRWWLPLRNKKSTFHAFIDSL